MSSRFQNRSNVNLAITFLGLEHQRLQSGIDRSKSQASWGRVQDITELVFNASIALFGERVVGPWRCTRVGEASTMSWQCKSFKN